MGSGSRRARPARWLVAGAALALAGCGGGGGGSGGSPAPTPSPAPVATPTPTPTPAASAFSVFGLGPAVATIFVDVNGNGSFSDNADEWFYTNRNGEFGRNAPGLPTAVGLDVPPAQPIYRLRANGYDKITGQPMILSAPVGATVISPLTSLIDEVGSQATVRQALGLDSGPLALRAQTDLLKFDAAKELQSSDPLVAQDARRIMGINLRLLSLAQVPSYTVNVSAPNAATSVAIYRILKEVIAERGSANLDDRTTIAEVIKRSSEVPGVVLGHLDLETDEFAQFFAFAPASFADAEAMYRHDLLFRMFVLKETQAARQGYPTVVNAGVLATMMGYFASQPRPNTDANFYALPDYDEFVGTTMTMRDCVMSPKLPGCNDPEYSGFAFGSFIDRTRVVEVSVDAQNSGKITALLNPDGSVTVSRKPGFVGLAYFDYRVESNPGALQATGRYYMRSR